jgi:hypothetical protein
MKEIKIRATTSPPMKITVEGGELSPESEERIKSILEDDKDDHGEKVAMLDPQVIVLKAEPREK